MLSLRMLPSLEGTEAPSLYLSVILFHIFKGIWIFVKIWICNSYIVI